MVKKTIKSYKEQTKFYNIKPNSDVEKLPKVKGYDFEEKFDFDKFIESYKTTGFQATNFWQAVEIVNMMRRDKAEIFLGYTSNMISSGVRESIKYLVKNKFVNVLVTTAGGIEEDIIKCLKPFAIGTFNVPGKMLYQDGISRAGNVFIPNDRYHYFEQFINPFLDKLAIEQKKTGKIHSPSEIIKELGKYVNNEESVLYWAYKNEIPVFCPALLDGSFGDLVYYLKYRHPEFKIDIVKDTHKITDICINADKTGVVILGGGTAKHFILNANIFREGADYAVYINTGEEYDGSDSGARIDEAITWGKIKANAPNVKIHADATLIFPLLIAATFGKKN